MIAGGSSFTDDYVRSLEELARADPRVVLAGYVYGEALAELYSNAAAFVLPSKLEGLPLTLLEAASYGAPVVASDIPPHLEIVSEDAPGHRVFTSGSEDGLVAAIERARADGPADERPPRRSGKTCSTGTDGIGSSKRPSTCTTRSWAGNVADEADRPRASCW